jgi:CheY-like chemotaxis protein
MFTLLIVEDHDANRKMFCDLLQVEFLVLEARSAEEALERLTLVTPDLILLDCHLPGMDGVTLARRLKGMATTADIPVVVVSGAALPHELERARKIGCVDFIAKPITDSPVVFIERLMRHLRRQTATCEVS